MVLTVRSSFVYQTEKDFPRHAQPTKINIRATWAECHCETEPAAWKERCANGWILYSVECERFDDVSSPCSTDQWLLHWIELRSLSRLECTVDHDDLLVTVSTALPCEGDHGTSPLTVR